jgi:uncharacterized membrane protein YqjE
MDEFGWIYGMATNRLRLEGVKLMEEETQALQCPFVTGVITEQSKIFKLLEF